MGLRSGSILITSVRSCLSRDRSFLLRTYAIIATFISLFAIILLLLAFPTWMAQTSGSATLALSQGLLFLSGIGVVAAVMAPVVLAHHRLPEPAEYRRVEAYYGAFGYTIVTSIYIAFIISAPAEELGDPPDFLASVVSWLNDLDPLLALVPPVVVLIAFVVMDRQIAT